jgi:glycosyltransferase involved in cell wall biosynthesis
VRVILATTATDVGGVMRHVLDLGTELRERGHEVEVASTPDAEPVLGALRQHRFSWRSLEQSLGVAADVWHLHLPNTLDHRVLPLMLARRLRARGAVVLTEHLPRKPQTDFLWPDRVAPPGKGRPGAAAARRLMKQGEYMTPDAIIAVSAASADFMARRWKVSRARFTVIHNGVSLPALEPVAGRDDAPMRVVGIGALHALKGFDVLLESVALARTPWSLLLIGDGPERGALEARAAALPDGRDVKFTGWRENAATGALEGDVLCSPSRAESFSYVILEAMALGRPVVASAVDGSVEAIRDRETGLLVPPENAQSLAEALDGLAQDPERRLRMGVAARERVVAHFQVGQMVDGTLAAYERARSRRRGARRLLRSGRT